MLSRVDERTGFITPQQPVTYKVLIPAEQSALSDDLNRENHKDFAKNAKFFSYMKHFVKIRNIKRKEEDNYEKVFFYI